MLSRYMYTLFRTEKLNIWIHRPYAVPFHAIHYAYKTFFISHAYRTSKIIYIYSENSLSVAI